MYYIGIDPGLSGGIAVIDEHGTLAAYPMPDTERDIFNLFLQIDSDFNCSTSRFAMIEKVHSMPKQGVASSFKFGMNYGFLRACLIAANIPFDEVSPQRWQKALGCLSHGDKNVTKSKAQQLYPHIKVTHAIADAMLIAHYCKLTRG
jgi:Holliday junction resolvasome RuvABC endonuclease subunit